MTPSVLHFISLWIWSPSEEKPNSFQGPTSVCVKMLSHPSLLLYTLRPSFCSLILLLPLLLHLASLLLPSILASQVSVGHLAFFVFSLTSVIIAPFDQLWHKT